MFFRQSLFYQFILEFSIFFQYLRKLNRQERVVEEVKLVLKPYYNKKYITKDDYKEILRRSVPKVNGYHESKLNKHLLNKTI